MEYSKWRSAEVVRVGFSWLVAASRSRPTASTSVSGAIKSSKIWRGTAILICNCLRRDTAVIGRMRHFSALFKRRAEPRNRQRDLWLWFWLRRRLWLRLRLRLCARHR